MRGWEAIWQTAQQAAALTDARQASLMVFGFLCGWGGAMIISSLGRWR
jgi:hypothetical protein